MASYNTTFSFSLPVLPSTAQPVAPPPPPPPAEAAATTAGATGETPPPPPPPPPPPHAATITGPGQPFDYTAALDATTSGPAAMQVEPDDSEAFERMLADVAADVEKEEKKKKQLRQRAAAKRRKAKAIAAHQEWKQKMRVARYK